MAKATYKDAGVDLDIYEESMARLPRLMHRTYSPRVIISRRQTMSSSLSTRLTEALSLVIEHEYLHDATPPPGVARDDQRFSVLFRLEL